MFYTIISRLPVITQDKSDKKFFKIFLTGSIIYILLHHYLYSMNKITFLDQFKGYLYYAMIVDLFVAYFLTKNLNDSENNDNEESDQKNSQQDNSQHGVLNQNNYTLAQQHAIMRNLEEERRLQNQIQKQQQKQYNTQSSEQSNQSSQKSPFVIKTQKIKKQSRVTESDILSKNKKKNNSKKEKETQLPMFYGNE